MNPRERFYFAPGVIESARRAGLWVRAWRALRRMLGGRP
jgi:hypothetical protein